MRGGVGIPACENTASRSQPSPLRGTSFQRKEGEKMQGNLMSPSLLVSQSLSLILSHQSLYPPLISNS